MSSSAKVENSLVTDGWEIYGDLDFSVLFENVTVEEGATVNSSLIMPGAVIKKGASVQYAIVAENCVIQEGASVGQRPEETENLDNWGVAVVGADLTVGKNAKVKASVMLSADVKEGETVEK